MGPAAGRGVLTCARAPCPAAGAAGARNSLLQHAQQRCTGGKAWQARSRQPPRLAAGAGVCRAGICGRRGGAAPRLVELDGGKLGVVSRGDALVPEDAPDLKNAVKAAHLAGRARAGEGEGRGGRVGHGLLSRARTCPLPCMRTAAGRVSQGRAAVRRGSAACPGCGPAPCSRPSAPPQPSCRAGSGGSLTTRRFRCSSVAMRSVKLRPSALW